MSHNLSAFLPRFPCCVLLTAFGKIILFREAIKKKREYKRTSDLKEGAVLPRIMNFGRIPNTIRILKSDEYEYYSEFEKLFEYYLWEVFE